MQSLHDSLNAAVEDVGDVLEQDVSRAGFLCQAYDFEEKARLLSLQAASSSEIADIRARKPGGDDVDGPRPGDVPRGEGADVVPDRGGGKVSGMHSCFENLDAKGVDLAVYDPVDPSLERELDAADAGE